MQRLKTVILCGGRGLRLGNDSESRPKALIEIGGKPLLIHLIEHFARHGQKEFILCLGYLGDKIRDYFVRQYLFHKDFTLDTNVSLTQVTQGPYDTAQFGAGWRITFAETGPDTETGGRLKRIQQFIGEDPEFFVTYGDGLADVDLSELLKTHRKHGKTATITAVQPHSNFGILKMHGIGIQPEQYQVSDFEEKPKSNEWVNGGFFVFNTEIFKYLDEDGALEGEPLKRLIKDQELFAFQHKGFWKCLDTYKDQIEFNQLWKSEQATWKIR